MEEDLAEGGVGFEIGLDGAEAGFDEGAVEVEDDGADRWGDEWIHAGD